jgi:hypothetical protein
MPDLKPQITTLRDDSLRKLNELHDEYDHSRKLWRMLQVRVERYGEEISFHNRVTGTHSTGTELAAGAGASIRRLNERTFKDIVGQFELFFADLLQLWLIAHPELVEEKALDVGTLLRSTSLADAQRAAVEEAAASTVLKKAYAKPADWIRYINRLFSARVVAATDGEAFAEMKATRDVLEHARGIANATYREKAGAAARCAIGDRVEVEQEYHTKSFELVRKLITDIALAAFNAA